MESRKMRGKFLHIGPGNRESYENWKTFLQETTWRVLKTSPLVATDGKASVVKAVEEIFPLALRQRCQRHKIRNILGKAPLEAAILLKKAIHRAFHADSYEQGLRLCQEVVKAYRDRFLRAMKYL